MKKLVLVVVALVAVFGIAAHYDAKLNAKPEDKPVVFDKIRAKEITVGNVVIAEGGDGSGGIWISPQGTNGPMVAIYANKNEGPVIGIWSSKPGETKGMNFAISADPDGNPTIQVITKDGKAKWVTADQLQKLAK